MSRLTPKAEVVRSLFALSGNRCAFPDCDQELVSDKGTFIAQICHIEAANKGGERYNPAQSDEQRRDFANLLLLCYRHHRETDDEQEYTVERMREIKTLHEQKFKGRYALPKRLEETVFRSIQTQLDHIEALSQQIHTVVQGLDAKANLALEALTRSSVDADSVFESLLEAVKNLKLEGKTKTAIDLLYQFKAKHWPNLQPEQKYKVLANLGLYHLDMQDRSMAAKYLTAIKDIPFRSGGSLANLCLGYALAGKEAEFDTAFKEAVQADEENVNLWVAYVERHRSSKTTDELIKELPRSVKDSAPGMFAIANLLVAEGRKPEAIQQLEKSLQDKNETPDRVSDTKAFIAAVIMQDLVDSFKFVNKNYSPEELDQLDEAKTLLTEAWNAVDNTELATFKWKTLHNRGVVNKITGNQTQALADFQKAFGMSGDFLAFKNLLVMHLDLNDLDIAQELVLRIKDKKGLTEDEMFELQTFEAKLIFQRGNFKGAVEKMSLLLDDEDAKKHVAIVTHILALCFENRQLEEAVTWCELLVRKFPESPTGYIFFGLLWRERGNKTEALRNYDRANSLVNVDTPLHVIHELAAGFQAYEMYGKAIPLYEKLTNKNILNNFSRGLIYAYYQYGDLQAAFALTDNLYQQNPTHPFLAEILINIHQETKQYEKAITIVESFLATATGREKDYFSLRGATLYSFNRDEQNTKRLALQVSHPERIPLTDAFRLAKLLVNSGAWEEGMKIAFETRTRFFDDSEAHLYYIQTCLSAEKGEEYLFPETVRDDSAVVVQFEGNQEKTFIITAKNGKGENILRPDDSFAKLLLGKAKRDPLPIDRGFGLSSVATIVGIIDIYTFALRESMGLFETRFAGEQGIGVFHADPGNPADEIEKVVKNTTLERNQFDKQLLELYEQGKATIGVLAGLHRRNCVMQWFSMVSSSSLSILCFSQNEHAAATYAWDNETPIVVDLTALLTLFFITNSHEILNALKNKIIVGQSTIEELQHAHDELEYGAKEGIFALGFENGAMVGHKQEKETIQKHRAVLEHIVNWCRQYALIKVPTKLIEVKRQERDQRNKVLGECFYDTMLLAEEYQAAVLSDDATFKQLVNAEPHPKSFSTYQLMFQLTLKGKTDKDDFNSFRMLLIRGNNVFIPVDNLQLWKAFDLGGYQLIKPFTVAVQGLRMMQPQFAALNVAKFFKQLYLETGISLTREQTTLYTLAEISKRPDFNEVKRFLILGIGVEFQLLPDYRADILQLVSAF